MKEFLYDVFIDPFRDDWFGKTMGVFAWLIGLFLSFCLLYGVFYLIDSVGVQEKAGYGTVMQKSYTESYYQTTFITVGKTLVPSTAYYPEHWDVYIEVGSLGDYVSVSPGYYDTVKRGDVLHVNYRKGRISGNVYIDKIIK